MACPLPSLAAWKAAVTTLGRWLEGTGPRNVLMLIRPENKPGGGQVKKPAFPHAEPANPAWTRPRFWAWREGQSQAWPLPGLAGHNSATPWSFPAQQEATGCCEDSPGGGGVSWLAPAAGVTLHTGHHP